MAKDFVLALDEGTSSVRAIVFDVDGAIRGVDQQEFEQKFPSPGLVEHDANEIWERQLAVMRGALGAASIDASQLAALGITNQRETIVVWDRTTGEPIYNAIVWQDRRTTEDCAALRASGAEEMVRKRTGLLLDPYFSATKLRWLLDHVPNARKRAERGELAAGTIDCWLIWKLTGGAVHATDPSNACRTLLYDIAEGDWNDELLSLFDVPRALLPKVVPSSGVLGSSCKEHLGASIPIAGVIGDQQAALFGQLCTRSGMAKSTYGTGGFLLLNTGEEIIESKNRLLTTVAWQREGEPMIYALEGAIFIAGAAIQWLRDGLEIITSAKEVNELAMSVDDTGGVVVVPALAGLGAPYWDPTARGAILGLTRGSTRAHVARATIESIALRTADVLRAMSIDGDLQLERLRVDGGAAASDLLMQTQADFLDVAVERPKLLETTALGAASLAGLATGVWKNTDELEAHREIDRVFEPNMSDSERQRKLAKWQDAIQRSMRWATEDTE